MPSQVPYVSSFQEYAVGQLMLDTQAVLHGPGNHKIGVNGTHVEDGAHPCRPAEGFEQIGIREGGRLQERDDAGLTEPTLPSGLS